MALLQLLQQVKMELPLRAPHLLQRRKLQAVPEEEEEELEEEQEPEVAMEPLVHLVQSRKEELEQAVETIAGKLQTQAVMGVVEVLRVQAEPVNLPKWGLHPTIFTIQAEPAELPPQLQLCLHQEPLLEVQRKGPQQ
jgi:hypothetical protein